jgi:hypothetical protein
MVKAANQFLPANGEMPQLRLIEVISAMCASGKNRL